MLIRSLDGMRGVVLGGAQAHQRLRGPSPGTTCTDAARSRRRAGWPLRQGNVAHRPAARRARPMEARRTRRHHQPPKHPLEQIDLIHY
jgi:hypothetical protein